MPSHGQVMIIDFFWYWIYSNQIENVRVELKFSVIGQPATGLLVKVLKMRHKNELSGGHWTFMRKM